MGDQPALARTQERFIELLLDESLPLPDGWNEQRFDIYRNAYRTRVIDALRDSYPRTVLWVGHAAFRRAAIHHVVLHPPTSWTLDAIGTGFPTTLEDLFRDDPEVSELAWLEAAMHTCCVSADDQVVDTHAFTAQTANFLDDDWAALKLQFIAGTQVEQVFHRVDHLWRHLGDRYDTTQALTQPLPLTQKKHCVVWRQGLRAVFAIIEDNEGGMLNMMLKDSSYGEACSALAELIGAEGAVSQAGEMLGRWIHNGMVAGIGA